MAKSNASKTKYGYVWQGSQYEGLVCDFSEVLQGYGGTVLDPNDSKKVTVNSPEGVQALTEMVSWVGTISPTSITTYTEEPSRQAFQNGDALFMRNWPYAYSLGNDATKSKIAGKFDIHSMPYGGSNTVGHSCVGGWNMAINAFSKNPDASWSFMKYMLGADAQKQLAIKGSFTPALKSVYDDADVKAKQPLFTKLQPILQNSLPRPVSPVYPDLSNIIQTHVHQALTKQVSPQDALSALQSELQTLVSK
jgi:multiple sugar transport system substrate-binding protein